ncbi:MAG TPA: PQQ-binding-like beta-propeller repeat protein, partial [Vicinamibacterales bacterium]|nr:PQQ-binding-like beta-propeller repeat protein [Vicinamibacterales bacterium]
GTFYEGVMTTGYPSTATTDAVQANIVAARYDVLPVSLSRVTTFTPGSSQPLTATFTNSTGAVVPGATVRLTVPAGWRAVASGSAGTAVTFREPIASGASVSATFTVTAPAATGAGVMTATAQWTNGRGKASETTTARVRNVLPITINEVRLGPGANPTDQFVELYNASAGAVDLSGWRLVNTPSQWASVTLATIPAGTTLAPRAFYLLGLSSSGLAAPADRGATAIHVRSTTGLAAGQTIDIDGESRTAVSVGTAATAMTTVFVPVSTGPWITIPPGSTNLPVTSATGFAVGQPIGIDIGGAYEQATVTAVGKAATQTTLSTAAMAGATSIAVAASENISAGDTLTIGTGGRKERATVASAGTGIALAAPLTRDHASGVDVSDVGTGISFSPATRFPHRSGDAVQALGGGITLDRALANGHGYGAPVRDPRAATDGYQGPAPSQWFGGVLSARAGSIALLDVSGAVIVDAIVYGSQQSNSSGNGTIASPHLATLEADQGKGGCIAVVPAAGRGGPGAVTAAALDRSLGRFPDGLDADELCTDFLLQPATTMLAASTAGVATIKVASVAGFTAGQTLTFDSGANVETAVVATVGTPGATTVGTATEVGATVVPVASAVGFSAGQTITIDTGANEETAVVAAAAGGRGGARITVVAPLTRAHALGAQVSGSGITLTVALTRPHAPGTAVATDPPTPGAPNRYSNRPIPASPSAKAGQAQPSGDRWWTGYGNGPDNSRYFEARQIDKANVGQLQVAWTYPFGDTGSSPIVVRGVAYGRGRNGSLVAVNAQTGQELWVRERMNGMTSRGINYWESPDGRDQRLIFSMDSLLQEVDARTGTSIPSFGTNGVVDLRVGIDGRDPDTIGPIQSNTPGEIFENLLILGSATGEGYMSPPGDIRAYDVLTGRLVWTFHTVPRPGEYGYDTWPKDAWKYVGGTNSWGEMTIDTARGIAYVPIGSPTYDFYGADRAGANLFGTSIVALDARTGRRRWHFQLVHHDLWDMDPSAAPQLTTIRQGGRSRDVVAVTAKTGWLYVFDRVTGEPIWPIEERPVPKSTMEGEQSWPTQPVPTRPAAYIKHTFTVDDINPDLPAEQAAALRTRLLAADNNGIFAPISTRDTVSVPASNGGTLFGGAAAEPRTGAVYVVAHDNPGIVRLLRPGEGRGFGGPPVSPGQIVYEQNCQVCHGVNRQGTDTGAPLVYAAADPANGIAAGAPRFAGAAIRAVLATGKNRMPPFPHLSAADVDNLVSLLTTAAGGRGRGAFPGRSSAAGSGAPPDLIAGSGSAWVRPDSPGGRGRAPVPYPEGTPDYTRYTINEYHTVANGIRPPFTTIVKFDLNAPAVKWRIPFGDDPALAARGITGTGAPATNNGIILTASGLVFGAGLDNHIRAWHSDTGRQLWSSRFGGNFTGSPVMYVMGGKQYLLVAAASTPARRGGADPAAPPAPTGWVAYALPR